MVKTQHTFPPRHQTKEFTLQEYQTAKASSESFVCMECGMRPLSLVELKEHHEINHSCVAFCMPCRKPFRSMQGYGYHMTMHEGGTSCDICGKIVQSEHYLRRHKMTHSSERAFKCPSCGTHYKHKFDMTKHLKVCGNTLI